MSAIATETQTGSEFDELKTRLQSTWMSGNYDLFSSFMEKDAEQLRLWPQLRPPCPGEGQVRP